MIAIQFLVFSVLAFTVSVAQDASPDACILTCAEQACPAEFSGADVTDYSCFCTTGTAQIISCLTANCTQADLTTAEQLAEAVCAGGERTPNWANCSRLDFDLKRYVDTNE
jgi:hypothetical protein